LLTWLVCACAWTHEEHRRRVFRQVVASSRCLLIPPLEAH